MYLLTHTHTSPAHVASTMGFTECIKLLQAYRADIHTRSIHGATSMHEAAANGHTGLTVPYPFSILCTASLTYNREKQEIEISHIYLVSEPIPEEPFGA